MRHNLYLNSPTTPPIPRGTGSKRSGSRRLIEAPDPTDKGVIILETLARRALDLYKSDPEAYAEINNKIAMYPVNISIARQFNNRASEKELTKDLRNYLNQKIKEKR